MADKQMVLTSAGLKKLEEELDELKSVKRKEIADKIKVALSFGDLSENSEYDEAKNEQGIIEARIAEIEKTLQNVKVLDENDLSTEHVSIGNKVVLKDLQKNKVMELHIVGSKEVDMKNGKISDESPVGKACLGKTKGEIIDVDAPAGL
ncbi:MAG: transcription elongation factor GreA [Ruminiclostridium sp.]|nr:transcription elongation factor GreA [Ruminiclostridium sp.]